MFKEEAITLIKGYFDEYPDAVEALKNAPTEYKFTTLIWDAVDTIKANIWNNIHEFNDLLMSLIHRDIKTVEQFEEWFNSFSPDSGTMLSIIEDSYNIIGFVLGYYCTDYEIETYLESIGIKCPIEKKSAEEKSAEIAKFCLLHDINKDDLQKYITGGEA